MKEMIKNSPAKFAIIVGVVIIVVAASIMGITKLAGNNGKKPSINVGGNETSSNEPSGEDLTEPSGENGTTAENPTKPSDENGTTLWEEDSTAEEFTMPSEGPLPTKPSIDETEPSGEDGTEPSIEPTEPTTTKPSVEPTEPTTTKPSVTPTEPTTTKPADPVKDAEEAFKKAGGEYEVKSDGTVKITDGGNVKGALVVPTVIDGKKVTEIAYEAYSNNDNITSITIDCETVNRSCFEMCDKLNSVTIGPNVKEIEEYAFASAPNLVSVTIQSNYIKELRPLIFMGCTKLTSITLPASITRIAIDFIPLAGEWWADSMSDRYKVPAFTIYTYAKPGTIEMYNECTRENEGLKYVYGDGWTYTDLYTGKTRYVYEMGTDVEAAMNSYFGRGNVTVVYK